VGASPGFLLFWFPGPLLTYWSSVELLA